MNKNLTISLGERWNKFIDDRVEAGRYASASEIIREALRLLEEKEAQSTLQMMRVALIEGEESGRSNPYDPVAELELIIQKLNSR